MLSRCLDPLESSSGSSRFGHAFFDFLFLFTMINAAKSAMTKTITPNATPIFAPMPKPCFAFGDMLGGVRLGVATAVETVGTVDRIGGWFSVLTGFGDTDCGLDDVSVDKSLCGRYATYGQCHSLTPPFITLVPSFPLGSNVKAGKSPVTVPLHSSLFARPVWSSKPLSGECHHAFYARDDGTSRTFDNISQW